MNQKLGFPGSVRVPQIRVPLSTVFVGSGADWTVDIFVLVLVVFVLVVFVEGLDVAAAQ